MQARPTNAGQAALRRRWCQWTALVERAGRRGACRVSPGEYQALRQELLLGCRSLAAGVAEADRPFYHDLEELVEPWLTPQSLEQADADILADLLARCRQAEQKLGGRSPGSTLFRRLAPLAVLVMLGTAVFLLIRTADSFLFPLLEWAGGGWRAALGVLRRLGNTQRLVIAVAAVVLVGMFVASRTRSS
jgi:hypothetical protein